MLQNKELLDFNNFPVLRPGSYYSKKWCPFALSLYFDVEHKNRTFISEVKCYDIIPSKTNFKNQV